MVEIEIMGMVGGDVDLNGEVAGYPRIFYVQELGDCDQCFSGNTVKLYEERYANIVHNEVKVKAKFAL